MDSKTWTLEQAKRVWRINAAAIEYFATHPAQLDYRTEAGQTSFLAICRYFMTHPLVDELAPDQPNANERLRREQDLDEYIRTLVA